jgi:hypothetical protein
MNNDEAMRSVAMRWVVSIENYDSAGMRDCYAPGMRIWHNAFQEEMSGEEHIKLMERSYFHKYLNPKSINLRIDLFKGGFVLQHILTAHLADGSEIRMPICAVGRVKNGRITRIHLYLTMAASKLSDLPRLSSRR